MAVRYEHIGTNEDGTPRFHIYSDDPAAQHLVLTGKIQGTVEVAGLGTVDVSPQIVAVADEAEAIALSDAIGLAYVTQGHPDFVRDPDIDSFGFAHTGSDGVTVMNAQASPEAIAEAARQLEIDPETIVLTEA